MNPLMVNKGPSCLSALWKNRPPLLTIVASFQMQVTFSIIRSDNLFYTKLEFIRNTAHMVEGVNDHFRHVTRSSLS